METTIERVCLTPFKELHQGDEDIYDWVEREKGGHSSGQGDCLFETTEPDVMCPGIYDHPFNPGIELLGQYCYTDGHYRWNRDTWKYVTK